MRRLISLGVAAAAIVACGGVAQGPTSNGGGGDAATDAPLSDGGAHDARAPRDHRTGSVTCSPAPVPPEPIIPDAGAGPGAKYECRAHADCTAQPRGRCIFFPTSPPIEAGGTRCLYDECTTDAACAPGKACVCNTIANTCYAGNCRVDADCGAGNFCSPTVDGCRIFVGYYCHTPADTCTDDTDCGTSGFVCSYRSDTRVWSCGPAGCA